MSEDSGKIATLVESVAMIAHSFERLVRLAEDWSDALDLPSYGPPPPKPGKKKKRKKITKKKEHPHE